MKIHTVRKAHLQSAGKKTRNPCDFIQGRCLGKAPSVEGPFNLVPNDYPFSNIKAPDDYIAD